MLTLVWESPSGSQLFYFPAESRNSEAQELKHCDLLIWGFISALQHYGEKGNHCLTIHFSFALFHYQDAITYQTTCQYCNNSSYQDAFEYLSIPNDHIFPNTYDSGEKEGFKVNPVYLQGCAILTKIK